MYFSHSISLAPDLAMQGLKVGRLWLCSPNATGMQCQSFESLEESFEIPGGQLLAGSTKQLWRFHSVATQIW